MVPGKQLSCAVTLKVSTPVGTLAELFTLESGRITFETGSNVYELSGPGNPEIVLTHALHFHFPLQELPSRYYDLGLPHSEEFHREEIRSAIMIFSK